VRSVFVIGVLVLSFVSVVRLVGFIFGAAGVVAVAVRALYTSVLPAAAGFLVRRPALLLEHAAVVYVMSDSHIYLSFANY
jgi:hypothetical protein